MSRSATRQTPSFSLPGRRLVSRVIGGLTPTAPEPPPPTQFIQRNEGPNFVGNIGNRMRGNFQ